MFGLSQRGLFRDDGFRLRPDERGLERACNIVVLLVTVLFALVAFWELADTFSAGHYASASAVCTSSENMWRWGILAPAPHNTLRPPLPSEYYCHHPWGIFWVTAIFMKLFGHHAWACRLPAAIQSALTPPALYLAGRALWGPVAGAVAAASFAAVPIALSFSDMNALEVPVIFGTVLAIWGYARFRQTYARRFLVLGLGALVYAVCCDWAAVIFGAGMLSAVFVGIFLLQRWTLIADRRRIAGFWGLAVGLCALAVGAHLYTFQHFNQLNELFAQGNLRSTGADMPLRQVLHARKFWVEVSFTGFAIALGKLALPVLALRAVLRRSELEALPLSVFAMALLQYVVFKQGADIHIFWPHYFAEYFAFACAGLIQSLLEATRSISQKIPKLSGVWPGFVCLGVGLLVPLAILPDGLRALHYGHRSGGRFNENGHPEKPDKDKVAVLEWLTARMPANTGVILHPGMRQSLWVEWSMDRPATTVNHPPSTAATGQDRYYVADMRFMTAAEQEALVENFSITALDTFLVVDRAAPKGNFRAFEIERYAPSLLEAYWVSSSHDLRRIRPSPYVAWELRDRFELTPNEPPQAAPTTFEEMRIAHNIALARGDSVAADHWLAELLQGRSPGPTSQHVFEDGDELLGSRLDVASSFVYSVYFQAAGPDPSEPELVLHSVVEAAPVGSLVPKDNTVADVGMPFAIPPSRWKRGFVYASITEIIRRIGRERWYGTFRPARGGKHEPDLDMLYLP